MSGIAPLFKRSSLNPIIAPHDWPYPIEAVFNPTVAQLHNETILLCRVADRSGLSNISIARSQDGESQWRIDEQPFITSDPANPDERWGVEDPRVTWMPELQCWGIAYTVYGEKGPSVALALTKDFKKIIKLGVVLPPEDKDAALLPMRVNGEFILFHRPVIAALDNRADIRISRSRDLHQWGESELVLPIRGGPFWDSAKVGIGPAPVATPEGWLLFYHGVKIMGFSNVIYRMGLALLDLHDPTKVLRRSSEWVMGPEAPYEQVGNMPNVVFPCGVVVNQKTDMVKLYYGAADTSVCLATASLSEVLAHLRDSPQGEVLA